MHCFWWEIWYSSFLFHCRLMTFFCGCFWDFSLYPCLSTIWFLCALYGFLVLLGVCWLDLWIYRYHQICKNTGHHFIIYFLFHLLFLNHSFFGLCSNFICCSDQYSAKDSKESLCWSLSFLSVHLLQLWYFALPWPLCLSHLSLNFVRMLSSVWILFFCTVLWRFFLDRELVQG